jgi:hypothetical protein
MDPMMAVIVNVTPPTSSSDSSQNASDSTVDISSDSLSSPTSSNLLSPPPGLEVASRSGGKDKVILYPLINETLFYGWWTQTIYAQTLRQRGKKHKWGQARRNSSLWTHFAEAATFPQGRPKLRCKYCSRLLEHPFIKNTGTTAMKNHLKTSTCSYRMTANNSAHDIRELLVQTTV